MSEWGGNDFAPNGAATILAQGRVQRRNVAKRRLGTAKRQIVALKWQHKMRPPTMDGR
jgi:hypothetical protein